jgi:hypothetical protein
MIQEKPATRAWAPVREGLGARRPGGACAIRRAGRRRGTGWTAGKSPRGVQPVPEPGRPQQQEAGMTRPRAEQGYGFRLSSRSRDTA